jgi:hypothetical protein
MAGIRRAGLGFQELKRLCPERGQIGRRRDGDLGAGANPPNQAGEGAGAIFGLMPG